MEDGRRHILLIVGAVLAASIAVGLGASRAGVPVLVAFLALGMLLGSDGLGGIAFDDAELARAWASSASSRSCSRAASRPRGAGCDRGRPAALLSTVGVAVTALLTGAAAYCFSTSTGSRRCCSGRRRVDRRRGGLRDPALHEHQAPARPDARGRDRRQRPNGDRAHDRADRVDPGPSYRLADLLLLLVRQLGLGLVSASCSGSSRAGVFADSPTGRRVRAGRVGRGRCALLRNRRRARRQRLPRRLPRRPRGRQHAVAAPCASSCASTRASRSWPRWRCSSCSACSSSRATSSGRCLRVRPGPASRGRRSAPRRMGVDGVQRLHAPASGCSLAGPGCAAPSRSCSARSCSRRGSRRGETIFNAVFFVVVVSALVQGTALERVAAALGLRNSAPVVTKPLRVDDASPLDPSSSTSPGTTRSREPRFASSASRGSAARRRHRPRAEHDTAAREHRGQAGDRLYVLIPENARAALEDVFGRWRRRV